MKEYLKMDDVFDLPIKESEIMWMVAHDSPDRLECAVHAINSHDELVAQVERLRKSLKWAIGNLPFEHPFEWSDEDSHYAHKEAIIASGGTYED